MTEVTSWYRQRNVFVTGATGFVGKCLVEKLLRDCPDIGDIYLMIRDKAKANFEERKKAYVGHMVFSRLAKERSAVLDKIKIVKGDLDLVNLGIDEHVQQEICNRASVIFHVAADVRFDSELTDAYQVNVIGTKNTLDFALNFKQLQVFVHVSTTYSQSHSVVLEERHYPASIPQQEMGKYYDNIDVDVLNAVSHKYYSGRLYRELGQQYTFFVLLRLLGDFPNTYGFTKSMAEDLVYQYKNKLPIAVGRPAIVIMSWKEPMAGYTEGMHGINGWCLAVGRGVLRTMHCQHQYNCNVVQCDIVVNSLIVLAHERGQLKSNETVYYNIAESKPMTWHSYVTLMQPGFFTNPYNYALWYPGGSPKKSAAYNFVCELLFHLLPAIFLDMFIWIFRQRPIMLRIHRKISVGLQSLHTYLNNQYHFKTDRFNEGMSRLTDEDRKIFYDKSQMEIGQYFLAASYGIRTYFVNENPKDLPRARKVFAYLRILDCVSKTLIALWMTYVVLQWVDRRFFQ